MRTAYVLLAIAACSKHADAPPTTAPAPQTADWDVVPLGPDFSFPGAIKIPKGAKLTTQKHAGHVALADGTSVDFMQSGPQHGDYELMKSVFSGSGNQILIDRHSPTGFAFAYTQAATGAIKVAGANWTVEPGISCGLGLDVQKPITREQAEIIVEICYSLQATK